MKLVLTILLLIAAVDLNGQLVEIGASAGGSFYTGDLSPTRAQDIPGTVHPALGALIRLQPDKIFSGRFGVNYGVISGDNSQNENRPGPALNFRAQLIELYAVLEWNIGRFPIFGGNLITTPYLYAGGVVYHFHPQANYGTQWYPVYFHGTEGQGSRNEELLYDLTQIGVPIGAGLRFTLTEHWGLGLDFGSRKVFTDYLDDVSGKTVNYKDLMETNGPLAAFLSHPQIDPEGDLQNVTYQRGTAGNDWYFMTMISLTYRFGDRDIVYGGGGSKKGANCYKF